MELDLSQTAILTLPPCPSLSTMVLLPPSTSSKSNKPTKSKLVLGDSAGRITCYEMKRGEATKSFENTALLNADIGGTGGPQEKDIANNSMTNDDSALLPTTGGIRKRLGSMLSKQSSLLDGPSTNATSSVGITSLCLGGDKNDKLFATNGNKVLGISKKNKTFFTLTSNSSSSIEQVLVHDTSIYCRQEQGNFQRYDNGAEAEFHQVGEGVNWLELDQLEPSADGASDGARPDTLLGCQDRCIRVIRDGACINKLNVDVCVTSIGCYDKGKKDCAEDR